MNLAFFIKSTTHHAGYGGLEVQNKVLTEGLVKNGHTVVVYSPKKELSVGELTENGVIYKFVDCVYGTLVPTEKSWYTKSFEVFIADNKDYNFDLISKARL